ncbi:MAG TPA: 2-dehydro-3-deoxy-6-phosphogalactonate aldolase [Phenylobacterium sp.]|uniref:2-dehydro-3-deoxy-6-phosphogalactonate aldolase n=1 Tax=Phenylobacterium sp. TaxID=1871053 RepID=UPI002BEF3A1D|nr:2-dehydro-3-deoxy-6-phosphogalactonate aldolase [Phenylobacterium sp.]HSV03290.1 2-dehydro-3-deoxy-6-phosphogalactonate aldolase [Phenylobacterium sp.]
MTLDEAIEEAPVVAIVRGVRPDEILDHAQALYDAGVRGVEVPLNSPEPIESIRRLSERFGERMVTGGGTVLRAQDVERIAAAGGRIVVAPNTAPEVIRRAVALGLDPLPGFATPSEAFTAIEAGARRLKLFPAATYGPGHVKQLKAVLPAEVSIWAVGGVGAEDLAAWWAAGVRAFGLGGELYRAGQSVAETSDKARRVIAAVRGLPAA